MRPVYRLGWSFLRYSAQILFGYRVVGAERILSEKGVLVASNHVSYADPIIAGLAIEREAHFFAKRELFDVFMLGRLITLYNSIPVNRGGVGRSTLQKVIRLLRSGEVLLLFPEGTRSPDGRIHDAFRGIGMIASLGNVPIIPVYVRGTTHLWRSIIRRGRMRAFVGEAIPTGEIRPEETRRERYERIAATVTRELRALKERHDPD